MANAGTPVFFCCAFSWVLSAIFLLAFSFDTLQPRDMALLYNDNTLFLSQDKLCVVAVGRRQL